MKVYTQAVMSKKRGTQRNAVDALLAAMRKGIAKERRVQEKDLLPDRTIEIRMTPGFRSLSY